MLNLLSSKRKIELLLPCLGKKADDGGNYSMHYTELMLIYFGTFQLVEDEKVAIVDLDKNLAYIEHYAIGKRNYKILDRELQYLAKCLEWEFDPNVNFHQDKKIVFSKEFSLKLIQSGLLINADLCKDLVNVYKFWTFFTKIKLQGDNVFSQLPDDIIDRIYFWANTSIRQQFDHATLYPAFFKAMNSGKAKGKQLNEEIVDRKRQTFK